MQQAPAEGAYSLTLPPDAEGRYDVLAGGLDGEKQHTGKYRCKLTYQLDPMLKALGFSSLKVLCFQAIGFKYEPAPLHTGGVVLHFPAVFTEPEFLASTLDRLKSDVPWNVVRLRLYMLTSA